MLKIIGNTVQYNTYLRGRQQARNRADQLRAKVTEAFEAHQAEMQRQYNALQVQYAYEGILKHFKAAGFIKIPVRGFKATQEVPHKFDMKGHSKTEPGETAKIRFEILEDGTVITDSNYIPRDLHDKADAAMAHLEQLFGNQRSIKGKEIPAKYKNRAFCHQPTSQDNHQKNEQK